MANSDIFLTYQNPTALLTPLDSSGNPYTGQVTWSGIVFDTFRAVQIGNDYRVMMRRGSGYATATVKAGGTTQTTGVYGIGSIPNRLWFNIPSSILIKQGSGFTIEVPSSGGAFDVNMLIQDERNIAVDATKKQTINGLVFSFSLGTLSLTSPQMTITPSGTSFSLTPNQVPETAAITASLPVILSAVDASGNAVTGFPKTYTLTKTMNLSVVSSAPVLGGISHSQGQ